MLSAETVSIFKIEDTHGSKERDENINDGNPFNLRSIYTAILSFIKVTIFCITFAIPWTAIPRTNSIIGFNMINANFGHHL